MAKPKTLLSESEFNALPEQVTLSKAELYAKTAEGYVLSAEAAGGYEVKPVAKLMGALDTERNARAALEAKIKELGDIDPKAAREALATLAELKNSPPDEKAKKQYEALAAQLQKELGAKVSAEAERAAKFQKQLEQTIVDAKAREALAKHKGNVDLLLPHVKQRIKAELTESGELAAFVLDANGNKAHTLGEGGALVPMSIEKLVEDFKRNDSYAAAFGGSGASGGGTTGGGAANVSGRFTISADEATTNPAAYRAVRAAAEKAGQVVQVI